MAHSKSHAKHLNKAKQSLKGFHKGSGMPMIMSPSQWGAYKSVIKDHYTAEVNQRKEVLPSDYSEGTFSIDENLLK